MPSTSGRLRRLAEELEESGLDLGDDPDLLLEEVDQAMRPRVHERRVPTTGTIIDPTTDPATWGPGTDLEITRSLIGEQPLDAARRFADGLSCWLVRSHEGPLGVGLVPSRAAESEVDAYRGIRHTSGRRYSFDDSDTIVIAVSEDGPVSVFH